MALDLIMDVNVTAASRQAGTSATADAERGFAPARRIRQTVSTLTRSALHAPFEVAAAENRQIDLGSLTDPRFLFVVVYSGTIKVRTSGVAGEALEVSPPATGQVGLFLITAPATGLWLENAGTDPVLCEVLAAGLE